MKKFLIMAMFVMLILPAANAEDIRVEASLERSRVSLGNPVYLYLTIYGVRDTDRLDIPSRDGLQIKYVGPSTSVSIVNGVTTQSVTHTYLVIALKQGEYRIGPFIINSGAREYKAEAVTLTASNAPSGSGSSTGVSPPRATSVPPSPGQITAGSEIFDRDKLFLTMDIGKMLVYINEEVPLTIKLYVNNLGLRDIEYPVYPHEGFSVGERDEPQRRREVSGGVRYETLVFRQKLFGIKEGNYVLGPAKLGGKVLVRKSPSRRGNVFNEDFFSSRFGYQAFPVEVVSDPIHVTILPFPAKGKPANFQGTVGNFNFSAYPESSKVKVGDPIMLHMTISGTGNLDTVTAPKVELSDKFKTYEPQVTIEGGKKVYEQVIIPKSADVKEIPAVSFSFFNPVRKKYETITKGPFPVEVAKQPESESGMGMFSISSNGDVLYPKEKIGEDIVHLKEKPGRMYCKEEVLFTSPFFWAGQLLLTGLFLVFYFLSRKKERMLSDKSYARFLKAPKKARKGIETARADLAKGDIHAFYDTIFKVLQVYFAGRFNLPRGNITVQVVKDKLASRGIDEEKLKNLSDIFSKCEIARYAPASAGKEEAAEILEKTRRVIDYMEKLK
ncbi:MAG: protein BatD [Candidatus Omnitrophica bacterium]|nr:protein BatD [Candidatus Omnitrophota bacterium]